MIEAAEASRQPETRQHDRRANLWRHRRRNGDGGRGQGLPLHLRVRDQDSEDKRNEFKATRRGRRPPTVVAPEHPDSYYNVSDKLASQPGAWKPTRLHPPRSALALQTTGPVIWRPARSSSPTRDRHGTGGIITGSPLPQGTRCETRGVDIQVIGVDGRDRCTPAAPDVRTWSKAWARRSGRDLRPHHRGPADRGFRRGLERLHASAGPGGGAADGGTSAWRRSLRNSSPSSWTPTPGQRRGDRGPPPNSGAAT